VAGDDNTAHGGAGHDAVNVGGNRNTVRGNAGDDVILVQGSDNTVHAGLGADIVKVQGARNTVWGGPGADVIIFEGGSVSREDANTFHGGAGNDIFDLRGFHATAHGGLGNDSFLVGPTGWFSTVNGGQGDDHFTFEPPDTLGVPIEFLPPAVAAGFQQALTARTLVQAFGGAGNDVFVGSVVAATLHGGPGDDLFDLSSARITTIIAGTGDDVIRVQGGQQVTVQAGAGDDVVVFDGVASLVYGGTGDDELTIGGQLVVAFGGNGADRLVVQHGWMNVLVGGLRQDELITLSTEATYFVFESVRDSSASAASADVIRGFTPGRDVLFLGGIAAEAGFLFDPATMTGGFVFSGVGPLQGIAGEVSVVMLNDTDSRVLIDVDGDGQADSSIILADVQAEDLSADNVGVFGISFADAFLSVFPIG
jgi:Ca2+-binding RTX toxin-like protein